MVSLRLSLNAFTLYLITACHCDTSKDVFCSSPTYSSGAGHTCFKCPRGTKKLADCQGSNETARCVACPANEYQPNCTTSEFCLRCRPQCPVKRQLLVQNCTRFTDIMCQCKNGYYWQQDMSSSDQNDGVCPAHSHCKIGYGLLTKGDSDKDTECEPCEDGVSFSNVTSHDPCEECTVCSHYSRACTPAKDSLCDSQSSDSGWPPWAYVFIGVGVIYTLGMSLCLYRKCIRVRRKNGATDREAGENAQNQEMTELGNCETGTEGADNQPIHNAHSNGQVVKEMSPKSDDDGSSGKPANVARDDPGHVGGARGQEQLVGAKPCSLSISLPCSENQSCVSMGTEHHGRQDTSLTHPGQGETTVDIHRTPGRDPTSGLRNKTVPIDEGDKRLHNDQMADVVGNMPADQDQCSGDYRDLTLPSSVSSSSSNRQQEFNKKLDNLKHPGDGVHVGILPANQNARSGDDRDSTLSSAGSSSAWSAYKNDKGGKTGDIRNSGKGDTPVRGEMQISVNSTPPGNQGPRPVNTVNPLPVGEPKMMVLKEDPAVNQATASLPPDAHDLHQDKEGSRANGSLEHDNAQIDEDSDQDEENEESDVKQPVEPK